MNKQVKNIDKMTNKQQLIDLLDYLNEDQIGAIYSLVDTLGNNPNKGDLMKLAYGPRCFNIDAAIPFQYVNKMKELYPQFDTFNFVTNCNSSIELENINDKIINNLSEALNN